MKNFTIIAALSLSAFGGRLMAQTAQTTAVSANGTPYGYEGMFNAPSTLP
jgi:hypothetical protein